jgi:hypothetical protein
LKASALLDEKTVNGLFANMQMILNVNREICKKLAGRIEDSSHEYWIVGDIFIQVGDFLKMYTFYCSNQETAHQSLEKAKAENPEFKKWLDDVHLNKELNGLRITDYLVKPIQRICKYPLLLRVSLKSS